ncbi:methyl-accepting chemotaxis protein [Paenibacillus sp. SC116]|uniref:methyl-accepting chemotaxis protein n=1 Tax=Paenibacillus sp. SC116 TaxID=2968986 RepID=UPI00215ADBF1|nr:methyl-accepting chemotaxis protein [Paenibacillus sp. SC116]MCR8844228.1 methyl-accepting chemotaxis protein [Paenibacillus sp. SC116]
MKLNPRIWTLRNSLKKKVSVVIFALILLPTIGLIWLLTTSATNELSDAQKEQVAKMSHTMTESINAMFNDYVFAFQAMEKSLPEIRTNDAQLQFRLTTMDKDTDKILAAFVVLDGRLHHSDGVQGTASFNKQSWYTEALASPGKIITSKVRKDSEGRMVITFSRTLSDGSGVMGLDVNTLRLAEMASSFKIGENGYIALLDDSNQVIVHPDYKPGTVLEGEYVALKTALKGDLMVNNEQKQHFISFNRDNKLKLNVVGVMDQGEIKQVQNQLYREAILYLGLILLFISIGVFAFIKSILLPIIRLQQMSKRIADGDLDVKVNTSRRNDEIGLLENQFNTMAVSLASVMRDLRDTANTLAASSEQLSANSEENVASLQQVAASYEEINNRSNGMKQELTDVNEMATEANGKLRNVVELVQGSAANANQIQAWAVDGERSLRVVNEQMSTIMDHTYQVQTETDLLQEKSKDIQTIVGFIQNLSQQIHLLALNAAIEAAHAGEQGRGFAVVANEVRKLAGQAQQATEQITTLIEEIANRTDAVSQAMVEGTESVNSGRQLTDQLTGRMTEMFQVIQTVSDQLTNAARVSKDLAQTNREMIHSFDQSLEVTEKVASEIETLAAVSEQQNAAMQDIAASANHLASVADDLQQVTSRYKLES